MKFFLVVIMCIGVNCETMWQEEPYTSRFECEVMASQTVQDLATTFRCGSIPVVGYIKGNKYFIDLKAVLPNKINRLVKAIQEI